MKVTFLKSASVIIEHEGVKVLCDPWLADGEFYGTWAHYPPFDFKPNDFDDINYIYVSHIHMDHCSRKTMMHLRKDIPVIIHNFHSKFLKGNIERMGFKVIELDHDSRFHLKNNLHINVLAADSCDPDICKRYYGCAYYAENMNDGKPTGTTQVDTMCVFDNNSETIVNANDCPFPLSQKALTSIKNNYKVDMLLLGFSSATSYPQCYDMSLEEKYKVSQEIIKRYYSWAEDYVNMLKPKYYLPFAGQYTIAGPLYTLNSQKAVPTLEEAYEHLTTSKKIDQSKHKCVLLNSWSYIDIKTGKVSEPYRRSDPDEHDAYAADILSKVKYDFENEIVPSTEELLQLIPKSYERFESMRTKMGYSSDWKILLELSDDEMVAISCDGSGYNVTSTKDIDSIGKYIKVVVDKRLLRMILKGPAFAHWNNADLGCHVHIKRVPNIYDRGLYYCMNYLHC